MRRAQEAGKPAVDRHQDLLDRVLGVGGAAGEVQAEREEGLPQRPAQPVRCRPARRTAGADAGQDLGLLLGGELGEPSRH
jgi:hypothetical protein